MRAARGRNESLDHVLIFGPPGLGKTTLAHIIAEEMDTSFRITSGPVLEKAGDLAAVLVNLEPGDGTPTAAEIGCGPRYFRWQASLDEPIGLDDVSAEALGEKLPDAAEKLVEQRKAELDEVAGRVIAAGKLP